MATRKELTEALAQRYREASKTDKSKILDEFAELTKYHRKQAIRVLSSAPREPHQRPGRNRLYDEAVRQTLIVLWEASDRLCGKRLKALVPLDRCHGASWSTPSGRGAQGQAVEHERGHD